MEAVAAVILEPADISLLKRTFTSLVVYCYDMYFSGLGALVIILNDILRYIERIARIINCVDNISVFVL